MLSGVPIWMGTAGVLLALLAGFLLGRSTAGDPDPEETDGHTGVVDSIDTEQGIVCLRSLGGGTVECYRAPGVGLRMGDRVQYRTERKWADAEHNSKQDVIVDLVRQ
jgi:hypothetical protein